MKQFTYNQEESSLVKVIQAKAEKKKLQVIAQNHKLQIFLKAEEFHGGEADVPVSFRGKMTAKENGTVLLGRFTYGFYLYTMVIVAALLIAARFIWSAYQNQKENMILCGIVTVVLVFVMMFVRSKSKKAKGIMEEFLNDLNKK
ncbi:MAG: hypothetical protein K6G64_09955 [Eubacterium sp.]|nr:hypothetical protein [Eubacterium sp.]